MEEWALDKAVGRTVGCGSSLTEGRRAGKCGGRISVKWEDLYSESREGSVAHLKREERPEIAV